MLNHHIGKLIIAHCYSITEAGTTHFRMQIKDRLKIFFVFLARAREKMISPHVE
jgi:hypothetical protein